MSSIKELQLSHRTVTRRVEQIVNKLESQLHQDLQSNEYFSLQFDKSDVISDVAQLCTLQFLLFIYFAMLRRRKSLLNCYHFKNVLGERIVFNVDYWLNL
ncbi:hypothetical protein C0J52_11095 [Blattella germanica]|nr:hypothetical protein C0J52_11095 [Blattella germanica]